MPTHVDVQAPPVPGVEVTLGITGIVLREDRREGLVLRRHVAVGREIEEVVPPGNLGQLATGGRSEVEDPSSALMVSRM